LPPPALPPEALRDLNERFRNGRPSSRMAEAGILIKVVDGMEDETNAPWHACITGWCSSVDHVSTSLINRQLPVTYQAVHPELHVAFLLRPDAVTFECAMLEDGGTVMSEAGGCASRPLCPGSWCVYPPAQLEQFVRAHLDEGFCATAGLPCRETYSEIVILKPEWERMLERGGIEAVACLSDDHEHDGCHEARDVWRRYLAAYGLSADQVPLVRYRGEAGFELVS
jgi:hypothetical protein